MDQRNTRILLLIEKFEQNMATAEDMRELEVWFQSFEEKPSILDELSYRQQQDTKSSIFKHINVRIDRELLKEKEYTRRRQVPLWAKLTAAASVVMILAAGTNFLLNKRYLEKQAEYSVVKDFAPGSNKATLTLGNGERISLNDIKNGELAAQGSSIINKADNGVVYNQTGVVQVPVLNTLTTPRAGEYHLTLADGTGVWLNAASSITYPSSFAGDFREVEISGEVYFEVAHNPDKPFRVKTGAQMVEVLGTHFNINAYDNENPIRTTLLEGSVIVSTAGKRKILKPGEQASVARNNIGISNIEAGEAIAWKDGFFDFTDADIKTIMQEFSRWYDLDIEFQGPQTKETFTGRLPRSWSFGKIMKIMEAFKSTHLSVKGRRIMVRQ